MATATAGTADLRVNQTWQDYEAALAERARLVRRCRINYDRGVLEVMPLSSTHERWKFLINLLIVWFAVEWRIPLAGFGSFTCRREDLDCGLEPDECYYVQSEPLVRGRDELDLERDPPPDLAVEVEVLRSAVNRIGVYQALGVPEIWRYDGTAFTVLLRGDDGQYAESVASRAFPTMPLDELARRLSARNAGDQTNWPADWQAWLRANP